MTMCEELDWKSGDLAVCTIISPSLDYPAFKPHLVGMDMPAPSGTLSPVNKETKFTQTTEFEILVFWQEVLLYIIPNCATSFLTASQWTFPMVLLEHLLHILHTMWRAELRL